MKIVKSIRKTKTGMKFAILGSIFTILFLLLLTLNHLNILRTRNAFQNFNREEQYEIVVATTRTKTKKKLFDYENLHFYSYGIRNISIAYNGNKMSLKDILEDRDFALDDFLNNFSLVMETEDKTIQKYAKGNLFITVEKMYPNETDIVFSKKNNG